MRDWYVSAVTKVMPANIVTALGIFCVVFYTERMLLKTGNDDKWLVKINKSVTGKVRVVMSFLFLSMLCYTDRLDGLENVR